MLVNGHDDVVVSVALGPARDEVRQILLRLDLRLKLAVETQRTELNQRARDPFRGLYISEGDVDAILATGTAAAAEQQYLAEPAADISPRLRRLAQLFRLDAFDQDALLVCLAPDIDLRYERLYAYLQDDVTRRRPTVDLILRLLTTSLESRSGARTSLSPGGCLLSRGLLIPANDEVVAQTSLLVRALRVDERVVEYLLGSDRLDPRVDAIGQMLWPRQSGMDWELAGALRASLVRALRAGNRPMGPLFYLHGASGSAKRATTRAACAAAGRPLLLVNVADLIAASTERSLPQVLAAVTREALLQEAVLGLDEFDRMLTNEHEMDAARQHLRRLLRDHTGAVVLLGDERWEPATWFPATPATRLELRTLGVGERIHLWRSQLNGDLPHDHLAELATRYHLADDDAIQAMAADAAGRASLRGDATVSVDDFRSAARAIAAPPMETLARHVEPRYGWDDIVLPSDGMSQLQEICARLRHQGTVLERWGYGRKHARRGGITALFAGQPGTGKTMAAEIIAGDLGLDLYRIDLSAVVSKYIGETEKNLEKIFRAADQGDAVLLFDEADAIFGKRSEVRDARDRYANVEVAYLLQRLEAYDGLAVLTTNLRGNIDEAFIRRLDCVLEFPMPDAAERLRIWQLALPHEAPVGESVDLVFLAHKFKLSGGHIRNIALTAGFFAAAEGQSIGMRHLVRATRREYQKLGKLVAEADFEQYFALLRE
jgi:SpoVK/Ycf46/Vps4 family AAA+-type ATPase